MGGMLAARTKKRCTPDRLSLPQWYMRQRWYDSQLQRFISRDAIMMGNRYEYAGGQPNNMVDTSGLAPVVPFIDLHPNASRTRQSKIRIIRVLKRMKLLRLLKCVEKAWNSTTIVYGNSTERGVSGFSDPKPSGSKLYIAEGLNDIDTDLSLLHETLHIVTYIHSGCDCLPEEMQVTYDMTEFKPTFGDYSWEPTRWTPYPIDQNNNRHRVAHSWIYLQESLLWEGMNAGRNSSSAASYSDILKAYRDLGGGSTENIEMLRGLAPTVIKRFDIPMDFPYRSSH